MLKCWVKLHFLRELTVQHMVPSSESMSGTRPANSPHRTTNGKGIKLTGTRLIGVMNVL